MACGTKSFNPGTYFLLATEYAGFVKIGRAKCARDRILELRFQLPFHVDLLAWIPAKSCDEAHEMERSIHSRFLYLRHCGEWHAAHADLIKFMRENCPKLSPRFDELTKNLVVPSNFEMVLPMGTRGDPAIKAFRFEHETRETWLKRLAGIVPTSMVL